ncbi:hypothetical protein DICSQDRAFT_61872, partial [Dichomitus squalens LYAD-421 SS1]
LGGLSTVTASYLARVRGVRETGPETPWIRARDLKAFIRHITTYIHEHGHESGQEHNDTIWWYRARFQDIMENVARKSEPPTMRSAPSHV